jgi:ribosomal protein S16
LLTNRIDSAMNYRDNLRSFARFGRKEGPMQGLITGDYHIQATARFDERTGFWTPKVRIALAETGKDVAELTGPEDRFTDRVAAERHGMEMGAAWVDSVKRDSPAALLKKRTTN